MESNVVLIVFISVTFGGLFLYLIIAGTIKAMSVLAKRYMDYKLKVKLVERGYSPREIELVLERRLSEDELDYEDKIRKPQPPIK